MARPTLADWMRPPGNRWSFRHARELMPSARIRRGDAVRALPAAPRPELLALPVPGPDGAPVPLADALAAATTDALVVLHEGRLVLEWYAPGVAPHEPHLLFSVSKSVTGLLAGVLADEGLLDLAADAADVVPEVAGSGFAGATVRDLLDMRAGIGFVEDYSPGPDVRAYREAAGWYPAAHDAPGLHAFLADRPAAEPHGGRFRYLSPTSDMLGWACERAAGVPYAEALGTRLWARIGAEADAEVTLDRYGAARAAGGISATPRDLARLGQAVLDGAAGPLPAAFVDDLVRAGDRAAWAAGDYAAYLPDGAYRSAWYRPSSTAEVVCGIGIHGQLLVVDRDRDVVVALLSSWPVPDDEPGDHRSLAACAAIAATLAD